MRCFSGLPSYASAVRGHRVFKRVELNVAFPDGAGALYVPLREGVNCA